MFSFWCLSLRDSVFTGQKYFLLPHRMWNFFSLLSLFPQIKYYSNETRRACKAREHFSHSRPNYTPGKWALNLHNRRNPVCRRAPQVRPALFAKGCLPPFEPSGERGLSFTQERQEETASSSLSSSSSYVVAPLIRVLRRMTSTLLLYY